METTILCPRCNQTSSTKANYCWNCGKKLNLPVRRPRKRLITLGVNESANLMRLKKAIFGDQVNNLPNLSIIGLKWALRRVALRYSDTDQILIRYYQVDGGKKRVAKKIGEEIGTGPKTIHTRRKRALQFLRDPFISRVLLGLAPVPDEK